MRVGKECFTAILDLNEGVCSTSETQSTTSTSIGALVGGTIAGVVVLVLALATVFLIVRTMRHRCGYFSFVSAKK